MNVQSLFSAGIYHFDLQALTMVVVDNVLLKKIKAVILRLKLYTKKYFHIINRGMGKFSLGFFQIIREVALQ